MNRIQQEWAEDIATAIELLPGYGFESVDFLCGIDPIFAGLHTVEEASFERSYRTTAHEVHKNTASDGRTTIVLPEQESWAVVVHELGHVLDDRQDWRYDLPPVSEYAKLNRQEAFAEAFTIWVVGQVGDPGWAEEWALLTPWLRFAEDAFAVPR